MKLIRHRSYLVLSITIILIALLGAIHILIRISRYSIILRPDSVVYAYFAETLAAGDGFEGSPVTRVGFVRASGEWVSQEALAAGEYQGGLLLFPPLFSIILALFRPFGIDPSDTGMFLNAIGFGMIILISSYWLCRHVKSHLIIVGVAVAIMISNPITAVSTYLQSDNLFILLTLLALVQMESFLSGRNVKSGFILSIVFSAMIPLTRWLGVTVILTGVILILTRLSSSARIRWRYASLYGILSCLPLVIWLARNWITSRTLVGYRDSFMVDFSLGETLIQTGDTLHLYIFVYQKPGWLGICLGAAAALIALQATASLTSRRNRHVILPKNQCLDDSSVQNALPFAAFSIIYYVTLLLVEPFTDEVISSRFLSPVFVPVLMTAALLLDRLLIVTYQGSGLLFRRSSDGWSLDFNRYGGPMAIINWILIGLIVAVFLGNSARNIARWIDLLTTYNFAQYHL